MFHLNIWRKPVGVLLYMFHLNVWQEPARMTMFHLNICRTPAGVDVTLEHFSRASRNQCSIGTFEGISQVYIIHLNIWRRGVRR